MAKGGENGGSGEEAKEISAKGGIVSATRSNGNV